ncbi:unnamed protein product [[Actinomadura] parvosata subsp. kistnae]|nr:hypothetical protein [Nonomuraea sp. ATCC 55076]SPL99503.1 unnamed protein product [Actinomadura parvosata subsp. kistnae]
MDLSGQFTVVMDEGLVLLMAWGQFLALLVVLGYVLLRRQS